MDQRGALQPRAHPEGCDGGQDHRAEEPRTPHPPVPEGGAGAAAQLPQGRAVRQQRGRGQHLRHAGALAREPTLRTHPLPPAQLQARHQAAHPRAGAAEGVVQHQEPTEPAAEGGAGPHRAGLRQPARHAVAHQATPAHAARIQGGGAGDDGHVQPPHARVRDRAAGEDHRRLPGPVPVVRRHQARPIPQLDQAGGQRASPHAGVQGGAGHQQRVARVGHGRGADGGADGERAEQGGGQGGPHSPQPPAAPHRRPQHRGLHDQQAERRAVVQGHVAHQQPRTHTRTAVRIIHLPVTHHTHTRIHIRAHMHTHTISAYLVSLFLVLPRLPLFRLPGTGASCSTCCCSD